MNTIPAIAPRAAAAHAADAPTAMRVEAFDEFKTFIGSPKALGYKLDELKRDGCFTIPMSPQTQTFFQGACKDEALKRASGSLFLDWQIPIPADKAKALTQLAHQVVHLSLGGRGQIELKPLEMELRAHGPEIGTKHWHTDLAPKVLACVALVEGKGTTQFLAPEVAQAKFQRHPNIARLLLPKAEISKGEIQNAPENAFVFFLADGLRDKGDYPILIHRAPPVDASRTIFLARWALDEKAGAM